MIKTDWTAPKLLQLSGAYWSGCALQAGVQLDIFTALSEGARDEQALAEQLHCDRRSFGMLVTALVSLGLLERNGESIQAPLPVLSLLSRHSSDYLGFIIQHHAHIQPGWTRLSEAVRTGRPNRQERVSHTGDDSEREAFLLGMFNIARLQAEQAAAALDLSCRHRLLDIGGGPGTYAVYFCRSNPQLRATIFDLPATEPFARRIVQQYALSDRIDFIAGDFLSDPLPAGQDIAWLSQVLHGEHPANAASLVKKAAACLNPGGLLCVQEFVLDDDRSGPPHAALFSLNMLVQTEGGQAYTGAELTAMLAAAGAKEVHFLDVKLPNSCRVAVGQMP